MTQTLEVQSFIAELTGFVRTAEETLNKIEGDLEGTLRRLGGARQIASQGEIEALLKAQRT